MRFISLILIFLVAISMVSSEYDPNIPLSEQLENLDENMEFPEDSSIVFPLTIGVTITDTEEELIIEINEDGLSILEEGSVDMEVNMTTETITELTEENNEEILTNEEELTNILNDLEVDSKSTKSHLLMGALEKKYDVQLVDEPSLWYKIIKFFIGIFVK